MVLPIILGIIALLGVAGLVIATSILLEPASILLGIIAGVFTFKRFKDEMGRRAGSLEANIFGLALAVLAGYLVYKSVLGLLFGGIGLVLLIAVAVVIIGPRAVASFMLELI